MWVLHYLVAIVVRILKILFLDCGRCNAFASSESFVHRIAGNGILQFRSHKSSALSRLDMQVLCAQAKLCATVFMRTM